jgi:hypothetical protein
MTPAKTGGPVMMNIVRLALVVSLSISTAACSGSPAPVGSTGNDQTGSSGSRNGGSRDGEGTDAEHGSTPTPSDPATDSDGGAPAKGGDKDVPPPDPTCVATCNSSLKAKCSGDDTFCDDVCVGLSATELACLVQAPTCDKSEWIRCAPSEGGGSK